MADTRICIGWFHAEDILLAWAMGCKDAPQVSLLPKELLSKIGGMVREEQMHHWNKVGLVTPPVTRPFSRPQ
jgi:hypothetical protein